MVSNPIRRVTTADIHHHLGEIFGRDVETAGIEGYRALAVAMVLDIAQELVEHPLLLVSSMSPGVYDGIISQYKSIVGYFAAKDMGIITAHDPENKSAAKLAEVKKLGESL